MTMRVVSTSNHNSETQDSVPRSKKPTRDRLREDNGEEFKVPRHLSKVSAKSMKDMGVHEFPKESSEVTAEGAVANPQDMTALPVNENRLFEGYKLFGSVFSMIEMRVLPDDLQDGGQKGELAMGQLKVRRFSSDDRVTVGERSGKPDNAIVIDLEVVRRRASVEQKIISGVGGPESPVRLGTKNGTAAHEEKQSWSRLTGDLAPVDELAPLKIAAELPNTSTASSTNSGDTKHDWPEEILGQSVASAVANVPPSVVNATRVDQIARAVIEHTEFLPDAQSLTHPADPQVNMTGQTLRMSLYPTELGSVEISVSKRGKRLQVTIVPELEGTGKLLLGDAEQLVKRLGLTNAGAEHVQIRIATAEVRSDFLGGEDQFNSPSHSQSNTGSWEERSSDSHPTHAKPQRSDNPDESRSISRSRSSDNRRSTDAIYL
jgi:Flagellar hook-length control protein FliK